MHDSKAAAEFHFRIFRNQDTDDVRRIVTTVLREYGLSLDCSGIDADLNDIQGGYIARGGMFLVIESDGALVGCGGLYPMGAGEAEIRKMYLLPGTRGRGLGRKLLLQLLDGGRNGGFRRVTLETASVLKEAIGLYQSFGFRRVQREHHSSRCDQMFALNLDDARGAGSGQD